MAKPTVFIDGEAGTTGLQIRDRLQARDDIQLVSIDSDKRKDSDARAELLNSVDVAILCLPDAAAKDAVSWVTNPNTKILDASSAHRTAEGWVYGFPELELGQRERIANARLVSNPGCYPTGFLSCVRPLVSAGVIPADFPITINAVSGYSGGGRKLIADYEAAQANGLEGYAYGPYGLKFGHKHVPEMHRYSGLASEPLFIPSVANIAQGMLVQVPLPLKAFPNQPTGAELHTILQTYYAEEPFIQVQPLGGSEETLRGNFLEIDGANSTNYVQVFVFANDERGEALLVGRLDNLGKGASGAAVQNLNIMLGLVEASGLI